MAHDPMSLTDSAIAAIQRGEIPPTAGAGPSDLANAVSAANLTPEDWTWLLHAVVQHRVHEDTTAAMTRTATAALESVQATTMNFRITAELILKRVGELDALIRPLFQTPDEPTGERTLEWRNLWTFWQFVPGTLKPRVLLTMWEFGNWAVASLVGYVLRGWGFGWLAWFGGTVVLVGLLFVKHELLYRWYGSRVCGAPEREHGPGLGFNSCLERWNGPTY